LRALSPPAEMAEAERRESVSIAFVTALQLLPVTQNAVLILRDVLGWTSAEVADLLDLSMPAVNSAPQRARATLRQAAPAVPRPLAAEERAVVHGFVRAWHRRDIAGLARLLREDVVMRMPPEQMQFHGRDAVLGFFATVPAGGRLETIRLRVTRANGQPALAAFTPGEDGRWQPYGVMLLTVADSAVAAITGFPQLGDPLLLRAFGLAAE